MKNVLKIALLTLLLTLSVQAQALRNLGSQSNQGNVTFGSTGGCSMAGLCTLYINANNSGLATDENVTFSPWQTSTPGGFELKLYKTSTGVLWGSVPLLGVYTIGSGSSAYNQVNFFMPGVTPANPYGFFIGDYINVKPYHDDNADQKFDLATTAKSGFTPMSKRTFSGTDGRSPGLLAWQHYNATTAVYTSSATCTATPSSCPISTGGVKNYIIFYMTGTHALFYGEDLLFNGASTPLPIPPGMAGALVGTFNFGEKYDGGYGVEQWNLNLANSSLVVGTNNVRFGNPSHFIYCNPVDCGQYISYFTTYYPTFNIVLGAAN